jgi:hypothetical protein
LQLPAEHLRPLIPLNYDPDARRGDMVRGGGTEGSRAAKRPVIGENHRA